MAKVYVFFDNQMIAEHAHLPPNLDVEFNGYVFIAPDRWYLKGVTHMIRIRPIVLPREMKPLCLLLGIPYG